jgi:hypothetical protein
MLLSFTILGFPFYRVGMFAFFPSRHDEVMMSLPLMGLKRPRTMRSLVEHQAGQVKIGKNSGGCELL